MNSSNKTYQELSAEELQLEANMIRSAQEDPKLFEPLYKQHFKAVYLFLLKRCGHEALAEDLCSQTFVKAIQNLKKYSHTGVPFKSWLFRIAYNEFLLHHRSEKTKRAVYAKATDIDDLFENPDYFNEDERLDKMKLALTSLNEDELFLIEMKYFEGKSYQDICDITGYGLSNAKVKMHRIIKKLNTIVK